MPFGNIDLDQYWFKHCLGSWQHQARLSINEVLPYSAESNFTASAEATFLYYEFKNFYF